MKKLKPAENQQAYLKAGILGFPGTGKTYTAAMLAIGISKRLGDKQPVGFVDTETGSDFLIPRFKKEKVDLLTLKSQSFSDLLEAGKEAEGVCSVLIVDSITHIWRELCEAFQKRMKVRRLQFHHWGAIKGEWAEWTKFYLNSKMHIIVCGRAGYEYDHEEDEQGKMTELRKVGTKMKTETEFGFEPSLLIEMERAGRSAEIGSGWIHRAHILKDRTDTINGAHFDFQRLKKGYRVGDWKQTFKPFEPVFKALNIGGEHHGVDTESSSEDRFDDTGSGTGEQWARRRKIACEEIQGTLSALFPGQDAKSKKMKADIIEALFDTRSWTAVENKSVEVLEGSVKVLHRFEEYSDTEDFEMDPLECLARAANGAAQQMELG